MLSSINPYTHIHPRFSTSFIQYLSVFIAGACMALAFLPLDFYFLAAISPAVFFYFLLFASPRRAAWLGWWYGLGLFGIGVSWVFVAIYVFGYSSIVTSVLLTVIWVSIIAAYFSLQAYLSVLFLNKLDIKNQTMILLIVFPVFWVLVEWFRGWFLTGFPWLNLGYSQTNSVLSGYAPILGVYGLSWITVISASLLLVALLYKKYVLVIFSLAIIWLGGYLFSQLDWTEANGKPIKVSLIQGNVDQKTKWHPDHFEKRKTRYLSLTKKNWDSDLILWPENSLTIFYHQLEKNVLKPLLNDAKKNKTDIILGLPVLDREKDEYFSSLLAINSTADKNNEIQFYHKNHLVPFGEYVPLSSLLRGLITFFDLPMSGFTPGKYDQDLLTAAGQKIAPTICYEDAFGEDLIRFLPEATLILNASNNAWYGDSFAPHQHLQISQMRALETGRDLMRVTTNGVSALIDYKGIIKSRSPQFETYVINDFAQPRTGSTPYVIYGNRPVLFLIVMVLVMLIINYKLNFIKVK